MIKKILLAAAISAMMAAPTYAQVAESSIDDSGCRFAMDLSEVVMKGRQLGVPITEPVDNFVGALEDKAEKDMVMKLILDAYDEPKYSTVEYQQEAVDEFANRYYLACMQSEMR